MSDCGIESDLAGYGIFFVIGNGGAFFDFTPAWCGSSDVEKRTDQLRLPYVAMSDDCKIANRFRSVGFHKDKSFPIANFRVGQTFLSVLVESKNKQDELPYGEGQAGMPVLLVSGKQ